jgi:4-alpha-glucanotransferase
MTTSTSLNTLAQRLGILESYVDNDGCERPINDETRSALLAALGYGVGDEVSAAKALADLDEESGAQVVEPVRVVGGSERPTLRARSREFGAGTIRYEILAKREGGRTQKAAKGQARAAADGTITGLAAPALEPGTYELEVRLEREGVRRTAHPWLAVVPATCTPLAERLGKAKAFGIWANLYSIRSARGLGIGNVSDLAELVRLAAKHGGAFVGINPLHALRNRGTDISPYGPVSRLFRNPLYLDVARVPEFAGASEARARLGEDDLARDLERARNAERLDYELVARLQRPLLEALWRSFRSRQDPARRKAFERYRSRMGPLLTDFGLFCVLEERMGRERYGRDWRRWPSDLRSSGSREVGRLRDEQADAIEFHAWVQFELDRQLEAVARTAGRAGMPLGLYGDLALGSVAGGFDTWAFPGLFLDGVNLGAPPDAYAAAGQNWMIPPMHPQRLRADRFRYWRLLLRAAFDHCGMLRIDHAMGLLRQFWIPEGKLGSDGAYVAFPAEDLLGLLALESRAQGSVVVAEDLGTVPKGFGSLLARHEVLSSQVMFFERTEGGGFVRASEYSNRSLLVADTHDQASLAGWWTGRDIEIRKRVGMIASEEGMAAELSVRLRERELLLRRLASDGVLANGPAPPDAGELAAAVYRYLAGAASPLLAVSLDDLAGEAEPVNVPGVPVEVYPSWSRRMRADLSELTASTTVRNVLAGLAQRSTRG